MIECQKSRGETKIEKEDTNEVQPTRENERMKTEIKAKNESRYIETIIR